MAVFRLLNQGTGWSPAGALAGLSAVDDNELAKDARAQGCRNCPERQRSKRVTVKDELHHLIDALPESEAERLLISLHDRQAEGHEELARYPASLRDALLDDEPVTAEDLAALAEGEDAVARGDVVSGENLARALGWQ